MNKLVLLAILLTASYSFAQRNDINRQLFYYNSIMDADINPANNLEMNYISNNSDRSYNIYQVRGRYNLSRDFVLGAETSIDQFYKSSHVAYLSLGGRYNLLDKNFRLAFGAMLDVPVSEEGFFASVFTAMRYALSESLELASTVKLGDDPKNFNRSWFRFNLGVIYSISDRLNAISELNISMHDKPVFVGGGFEYYLYSNFNIHSAAFIEANGTELLSLFFGASYNLGL